MAAVKGQACRAAAPVAFVLYEVWSHCPDIESLMDRRWIAPVPGTSSFWCSLLPTL